MASVIGLSAETGGRQREVLQAIRDDRIDLPAGCEVTYEMAALAVLEHLAKPTRVEGELESFYRSFEERNGVRPTALETYHAGLNPRSNSERSWLAFVERMGGLNASERAAWTESSEFFVNLEKASFNRSHELVLLSAMFDGERVSATLPIDTISQRAMLFVRRIHALANDFSGRLNFTDIRALLVDTPIKTLAASTGLNGGPFFKIDRDQFGFAFPISNTAAFGPLLREIVDWRIAQYLAFDRIADVICHVARAPKSESPVLIMPQHGNGLPEGSLEIDFDGRTLWAPVRGSSIGTLHEANSNYNELPAILQAWFGNDAGLGSNFDRVRIRRAGGRFVMEPLSRSQTSNVRLWERYLREEIPPAFGLQFNPATWNVGFVVSELDVFLLVTLVKDDMSADHRYADHFISDEEFSWQSQNRTAQDSKHGRLIRDHRLKSTRIHLFVRPTKKTGQKATPFTYCGEVDFTSWDGNKPITVRWRLRERVPASIQANLKVPLERRES